MIYRVIKKEDDAALAAMIRKNLQAHALDIPGTAYFDTNLDHLSDFYLTDPAKKTYFVLTEDDGQVAGGIGLDAFDGFPACAELQKLYLDDHVKGRGLGYEMIRLVEDKAREMGYRSMYLETHTNLQAALHLYEKTGYVCIPKPDSIVHSTMNRFYFKKL